MPCSSCGKSVAVMDATNMVNRSYRVQQQAGPCEYNDEILTVWLDKLKWFKDKGLYVKYKVEGKTINKYLGIVITSLNVGNKCNYKDTLDGEIKKLVTFISGIQNA